MSQENKINPSPTGGNGRQANGRFASGNRCARGNPHNRAVQRLRAAFFKALTQKDFAAIVKGLVEKARAGDVAAIKEILNRTLGAPAPAEVLQRLDALEALLEEQKGRQE